MRNTDQLIEDYNVPKDLQGAFREAMRFVPGAIGKATNEVITQLESEQEQADTNASDLSSSLDKVVLSPKIIDDIYHKMLEIVPAEIKDCFGDYKLDTQISGGFGKIDDEVKRAILMEYLEVAAENAHDTGVVFPEPEAQ